MKHRDNGAGSGSFKGSSSHLGVSLHLNFMSMFSFFPVILKHLSERWIRTFQLTLTCVPSDLSQTCTVRVTPPSQSTACDIWCRLEVET